MARRVFEDIDALAKAIGGSVSMSTVMNKISPEVEGILLKHISSDIYGAYTPIDGGYMGGHRFDNAYSRRHVLEQGITSTLEDDGTLLVTSEASPGAAIVDGYSSYGGPGAFLQLLESGRMGAWRQGFARPAVSNAQAEVDNSPEIIALLQEGIGESLEDV